MASKTEIQEIMEWIKRLYPSFRLNPEISSLWVEMLKHYPDWLLKSAVKSHCNESRFAPTLADIATAAQKLNGAACKPASNKAGQSSLGFGNTVGPGGVLVQRTLDDGRVFYQTVNEKYAVHIDKTWKMKIDYCMTKLGAKTVNEILTSELKLKHNRVPGITNFPVKEYVKCLDEMVALSLNT